MSNFRDHLRKARTAIHKTMAVPAYVFVEDAVDAYSEITVRRNDKFTQLGDLKGTNFNYAEVEDNSPTLIFLRSEITPKRGMIVMIAEDEGYYVEAVLPPHGITVSARVSRMLQEDMTNFPYPGMM